MATSSSPSSSSSSERQKIVTERFPSHFKSQQDQDLIRLALHKSPFFAALDQEQVDRFVAVAERREFRAGEIVILEGCVDEDEDDEGDENDLSAADAIARLVRQKTNTLSEHVVIDDASSSVAPADLDDAYDELDDAEADYMPENGLESLETASSTGKEQRVESSHEEQEPLDKVTSEPGIGTESFSETVVSSDRKIGDSSSLLAERNDYPPPPRSGVKRSIYIIRDGNADVWYQPHFRPASLGKASVFGEGGFLFQRQHSASVVARDKLECWVVDFQTFSRHVLPASHHLTQLFSEAAVHQDEEGVSYMTMEDFVQTRRQQGESAVAQDPLVGVWVANAYNLLQTSSNSQSRFQQRQQNQAPRIYLQDFCFFHLLLARPDPEVDIAFLLMDQRRTGQIYLEDIALFFDPVVPGIDLSSHFFERYFGKDGKSSIRQMHFSQFMVDLQKEIGKQVFLKTVTEKGTPGGYLDPAEFIKVLKTACGWRLPQSVADRLESTYDRFPSQESEGSQESSSVNNPTSAETTAQLSTSNSHVGTRYFAYGDFLAFQEVLGNLPAICHLVDRAQEIKKGPISHDDFTVANRATGLGGKLSRLQVEIVFSLFDLDQDGYISTQDTVQVCGVNFVQPLVERGGKLTFESSSPRRSQDTASTSENRDFSQRIARFVQHFGLTAVASSFGVLLLYPLDLAKTRLMNERIRLGTTGIYRGWVDCLQKVLRFEGALGLYRGLIPQLIGVGPEKLIKLQVNDLLRQSFSSLNANPKSQQPKINLPLEVLAGACAGACQLLVTNPMEIVKIRMQLQGETAVWTTTGRILSPPSFGAVIRDLGFPGIYRGASACLLRDVPFSAIYFPTYAACKELLVDPNSYATQSDLLLAGTMAGVPAAFLTSPADVIKTRLQSVRRPEAYTGIRACATAIYEAEGWQAFFRGSTVRVLRLSPQFGITLLGYEQLTRWLSDDGRPDIGLGPPTSVPIHPQDYRDAFPLPRPPNQPP